MSRKRGGKKSPVAAKPFAKGSALVDHVTDGCQMPAGRETAGVLGFAGKNRPFIDAGQEADQRPLAEGGELLERYSRTENMMGDHRRIEILP